MKKIYIAFVICFLAFGCDDEEFLEKSPSINESISIRTLDDIDRLFNGIKFANTWGSALFYSTDHSDVVQSILDETARGYSPNQVDDFLFSDRPYLDQDDTFWFFHYQNLQIPNLTLETLDSGEVAPGDATLEAILRAESHFIRAFTLFELATVYGLYPSSANENEPGIVLKQTTSFEESLERATLRETFDFILNEIQEALKYPEVERKDVFRIGRPAVDALAARIYLYLGDYEKAEAHADSALQDFNTMVNYETAPIDVLSGITFFGVTSDFPSTAVNLSVRDLSIPEFYTDHYYYFDLRNPRNNFSPSQELMDLYDDTDIRKRFFVQGWFERLGATTDPWFTYMNHDVGVLNGGPGVPEMYLTRAECRARRGAITEAMADVEIVRSNRFAAADYTVLPIPGSDKEAVDVIIEERRREDPFEVRFMDIKRLNNDPLTDPITLTRVLNGETVTIGPDDRRWARPIGQEIIDLSGGQTLQNEY